MVVVAFVVEVIVCGDVTVSMVVVVFWVVGVSVIGGRSLNEQNRILQYCLFSNEVHTVRVPLLFNEGGAENVEVGGERTEEPSDGGWE